MKNKFLYILLMLMVPVYSIAQGFVIKGKVSGINNGYASLKVIRYINKLERINELPEKVRIVNGEFELKGKLDIPQDAILQISTKQIDIVLENTSYTIEAPFSELNNESVKGGKLNPAALRLVRLNTTIENYVTTNPDEEFSVWLLYKFLYNTPGRLKPLYALLSPGMQDSYFGRALKPLVESGERTPPLGRIAPVSVLTSPEGKQFSWDRFKGSILVVDFWASWCAPCRKFIPTLNEVYNEFNPKGVEFMSVSVDEDTSQWKKAMEQEKMAWHQAIGQDGFKRTGLANQFFFHSIPYVMIIGKDGKVVSMLDFYDKQKLRNELERLLAESK